MIEVLGSHNSPNPVIGQNDNTEPQSCFIHVLLSFLSSHILSGFCKMCGYEILRHGTSWLNVKSILKTGVDLRKGGKTTQESAGKYITCSSLARQSDGSSKLTITKVLRKGTEFEEHHHAVRAQGRFYVFRDSKFGITEKGDYVLSRLMIPFYKRLVPNQHSYLAYLAEYLQEADGEEKDWMSIASLIKAFFTPKLKFIYSLEEMEGAADREKIFENDPDYDDEAAYRTSKSLPNDRIGLLGFLTHVKSSHVWEHIKTNPGQFIQGIIQLIIGVILTLIPGLGFLT